MGAYKFYWTADLKQEEIWEYTVNRHSEEQAEKYIRGLHDYLGKLADNKMLWRILPQSVVVASDIKEVLYFAKYEHHFIYFKELPDDTIGIISILNDIVDLPYHLGKDLDRFNY